MFDALPLVVEPPGDLDNVTAAAEQAARAWNLDRPELIRLGSNGVFSTDQIVLRVSRPTAPMRTALYLAHFLHALGVRVARPVRREAFTSESGLVVTAWERIDHDPSLPVDWERLGEMVATVHTIDAGSIDHPLPFCGDFPWWNFDEMIQHAVGLDGTTIAALEMARRTYGWWNESAKLAPLVVCHGDVHPGNVLVDADGPVLIDWDLLCVGPRSWDHACLMTWTRRWGGETDVYQQFSHGYGPRVDDSLANAIAEMRLLSATLMMLRRGREDAAQHDEAMRRLGYWRGEASAPMWRAQ